MVDHGDGHAANIGPSGRTPDTVSEAVALLAAAGYVDELQLAADGLTLAGSWALHPIATTTVDYSFRFEGPSDPADEAIVLGVTCTEWDRKGVIVSAYGPYADPEHATLLAALANAAAAPAQVGETVTMTADATDIAGFLELETMVWEALRGGDAEADARLLAPDFVGLYPTGYADRTEHAGQLANGPTVADYELHEPRLVVVSPDDVLLCYRADWHRLTPAGRGPRQSMYVSSLWSHRAGRWVNVFSQDTPTASH